MKKRFLTLIFTITAILMCIFGLTACGKVEFQVDFVVDGAVYDSINTSGEETIKMPDDPEKEGYIFDGWYWDQGSWRKPFTANSLLDAPLSDNMSVYAKWTTMESLTGTQAEFHSFKKTGNDEYSLKVSNSTSTLSLEPLISLNSRSSWSLSTDIYGNQTIASRTVMLAIGDNTFYVLVTAENGSTKLYTLKIRRKPVYNVVFDSAGGTEVESQQIEEGAFAVEPETTKEGYDFSAWNYDFSTPITKNEIIVASWEAKEYVITYNANGGNVRNNTTTVAYGSEYTLEEPTYRGHEFLGWYLGYEEVESGVWQTTSDITLKAEWRAVEYTIRYTLGAGTVENDNPSSYTVESDNIVLNNPTRRGYVFVGWTGTDVPQPTTSVIIYSNSVGDREYVAHWEYDGFEITYHLDGGENHTENPKFYDVNSSNIYLQNATREGYIFDGWYTDISFSLASKITVVYAGSAGDLDLYAKWTPITYTVQFNKNADSATGTMADQAMEYGVTQALTENLFVRVGYTFAGWTTNADGTGSVYENGAGVYNLGTIHQETVNLYAKWAAKTFTVTFDKNGAVGGTDSVTATYDSAMPTATAPDAPIGCVFDGYYDESNVQYYDNTMTSVRVWDKDAAATLYARWSAATYTVTFDKQNGVGGTDNVQVTYGEEMPIAVAPEREGYTFAGYYTEINGGTKYYNADMSSADNWENGQDGILYAHWEAIVYTVTFNTNQGTGAQSAVTVAYGSEMPAITVAPTRAGYIFIGYYDALTGGTKYYNADLTSANAWANASNTTLYARWQGIPYYVSFNANSGSGTMSTQEFEYGVTEYLNSNAFTRTGYTFTGWNTEADGSGTTYSNGASILNLTNVSGETVTLYAQWTAKTVTGTLADLSTTHASYTVSFDLNGASGSIPSQTVTETVGLTYPTIPTRSGYIFAGWYTTSSCTGTPYDFTADVAENITLYAKWVYLSSYTKILTIGGNTGNTSFSSTIKYYPFVSLVNQTITLYTSHSSGDPKIYLYNSNKTQLTSNDDGRGNYDSEITYTVTAGTLYYAGFGAYSAGTGYMYLTAGTTYPTAGGVADGIVLVTEQLTYNQSFTLDVPTKDGYNFVGWYDGEGGTGTQYTDATGASVRVWDKDVNTTLYATWEAIQSAVTFDKQNGTGGTDSATATYDLGMPYATAPTKVGYTFMGYYTAISGGTKYYNADMTSARVWNLTEATTLYARWSANTYTITFDKQGGNGTSSANAVYGSSLPIVSKPTKTGYNFLGYYDAAVAGTLYYDANMSSTMTWSRTEDITLYAHWEAIVYTVTFNANQGTGAQSAVTVAYGSEMPAITVAPTREGYIFIGYYDALTNGTKYYNADLTSANAWANATSTTLYARWQGIPYYVSFNANSGSGTMSTQEFEYGVTEYLNSNAFTRTGYSFTGWNTEADGSGTTYGNGASILNLTNVSGETVTLYAQWTAKTVTGTLADLSTTRASYTVSFNLNGASGSIPSQTVTETVGLTYPTIPTRSGYAFSGWYTNSSGTGTPYDFSANVTADITLYAKWVSMTSSYTSRQYVDIANYNNSTSKKTFSNITSSSSSSRHYYYFTCYKAGTYTLNASYTAGDYYVYAYNTSKGSTVLDKINFWSSGNKSASASFTANAGDVIYVSLYKYSSSSSTGSGAFYVFNATYPTAGGVADGIVQGTEQLTYDQSFTLEVPTKDGYTFAGWYDGAGGTGTQYTDATGASVRVWDKDADTTLYAKWLTVQYGITYELDGGTNNASNPVSYNIETQSITLANPTKVGYTFIGWTTQTVTVPTKGLVINTGSMGDITLTAHWIEYDVNDITYNASVNKISISDELTAEYFGATCVDTDGNDVTVTATFVTTPVAGETVSVLLVATSGGKTTQTTIDGVKVYGTPTISVSNTTIKETDSIVAATFNAVATDSFGNALSISVSLVEGDATGGGYRTYEFTAVDCVGNEGSVNSLIMVYSADDIEFALNEVEGIKVGSAGEEFGAVAADSFGNSCLVQFAIISGDINVAGDTVDVRFTATDVKGNVSTVTVNDVKVYGTPVATLNVSQVTETTNAADIYTVRDSFGEELDATVTFVNAPVKGETVTVRVVATDVVGNLLNVEYELNVVCLLHSVGSNCTCEVCGTIVHTAGANCTCLICGESYHSLNANCVCTACGNEYHNYNADGVCFECGELLNTADVWDGTVATSFASGSGTSSNPYVIETGAQLAYLASRVNSGTTYSGYYFRLDSDIDLNNINWTPIGVGISTTETDTNTAYQFRGTFDGFSHKILNLKISRNATSYTGLFGDVQQGTIKNLGLENTNVSAVITSSSRSKCGSLIGRLSNGYAYNCYVINCHVYTTTVSNPGSAGGLIGNIISSTVANCFAQGNVESNGHVAVLIGSGYSNSSIINNCYAIGNATNSGAQAGSTVVCAAGIIAFPSSGTSTVINVSNCYFVGTVSSSAEKNTISWSNVYNCYYNITGSVSTTSGTSTSISNLQSQSWLSSTLGWDFETVWTFVEGNDYPVLKAFN